MLALNPTVTLTMAKDDKGRDLLDLTCLDCGASANYSPLNYDLAVVVAESHVCMLADGRL